MSTVHNAAKIGDIAETVLLPGDPMRAKFIAENFLEDVVLYNTVRGMLGYTGTFDGKRVSVQGTGMGIPSIGIYSHELITHYGVKNLIRVGSAGAISNDLSLGDIVIASSASTDSNFMHQYNLPGIYAPTANYGLVNKLVESSRSVTDSVSVGNILASDIFYSDDPDTMDKWRKMGVLAVEMESAGLFAQAARLKARAATILTISDIVSGGASMSSEQRETSLREMILIALKSI